MKLGEQTWKDVAEMRDKIVVIPTGAHEQHGHHLPLLTDAMIGEEIIRRADAELGEEVLFAPMLWLGHSPHHLQFPGTISVSSDTYIHIIEDIVDGLVSEGFRRLLFFNSHGGNQGPTTLALGNLQVKYAQTHPDVWLVYTSGASLAASLGVEGRSKIVELKQSKISHACEWETSQIMATHGHLVKDKRPAVRSPMLVNGKPSEFFTADYSKPDSIFVARTIDQNSPSGAFGWPELASAEKGEKLFEMETEKLVALLREFQKWPSQIKPEASV